MSEPSVADHTSAVVTTVDSAIHDLGYRRYDGERVGKSGSFLALYTQGLRAMFGLGRPAKAKIVP